MRGQDCKGTARQGKANSWRCCTDFFPNACSFSGGPIGCPDESPWDRPLRERQYVCRGYGRVFALVQASDSLDAVRRLRSSFNSGDPELLHLFDSLSERHLSILAGD